jgi:uncharacterized spore protein YtfJ
MTTTEHETALADELLRRIGETVGDRATASTVFGESVERAGITVIPVAKVRFGFGGGGGKGKRGPGRGGGGGAVVSPLGYIEVRDGAAQFKRIPRRAGLLGIVATASLLALVLTGLSMKLQRRASRPRRPRRVRRSLVPRARARVCRS